MSFAQGNFFMFGRDDAVEEAELMRAIADTIDCPMPRIIPDAA